jgi:hypothetical protein
MALTIGVFGISGHGKSTSIVINPDGSYDPKNYQGLDPASTVIINADKKSLPFRGNWVEGDNVFYTSDSNTIVKLLEKINSGTKIKSIVIDTINAIMIDKEMLESKKLTFDKWSDLAKDIYEIITYCNSMRKDIVVYFMGHVTLYTDVDGNESKCLITNGRKLEKIKIESKLPIVLFTKVKSDHTGNNEYKFETQANRSTAKSPIGMFDEMLIPNSLRFVDDKVREYYGI